MSDISPWGGTTENSSFKWETNTKLFPNTQSNRYDKNGEYNVMFSYESSIPGLLFEMNSPLGQPSSTRQIVINTVMSPFQKSAGTLFPDLTFHFNLKSKVDLGQNYQLVCDTADQSNCTIDLFSCDINEVTQSLDISNKKVCLDYVHNKRLRVKTCTITQTVQNVALVGVRLPSLPEGPDAVKSVDYQLSCQNSSNEDLINLNFHQN